MKLSDVLMLLGLLLIIVSIEAYLCYLMFSMYGAPAGWSAVGASAGFVIIVLGLETLE